MNKLFVHGAVGTLLLTSAWPARATTRQPGPSAALWSAPYYSCKRNYYVATTGSDTNIGTTPATAWMTLQHANDVGRSAGDCVNVESGTYAGVWLNQSGNLAASTGYIVYRCTTMDGCTINGTAGPNKNVGFFSATETPASSKPANFVMIDGFTIVGNSSTYGVGVEFAGGSSGQVGVFGSHHDWVLNSVITGFGQGGIAFSAGDYTYAMYNRIYYNARALGCDNYSQGSGLGDNIALDVGTNYVPTADDKVNPNPAIGSFVTGSTWFHKAYEWNNVYNNYLAHCGTNDTDGNNIILDTFGAYNGNMLNGKAYDYPDQTLIAFNIVFNAGGGGIHVFSSEYATVANNTSYNNHLDASETSGGAAIDSINSYGDTFINNIAVGNPGSTGGSCAFYSTPYAKFNNAVIGSTLPNEPPDTFSHNITQLQGGNDSCWGEHGEDAPTGEIALWNGDTYSSTDNKEATNPQWVNVGTETTGTEAIPPLGRNFALKPGSPAIGYGLTETYLPAQSVDVGACASTVKGICW